MSDDSEKGAVPADDAVVEDPPTEEEVRRRQEREHPEQARTASNHPPDPTRGDPG
jgi:hypothetical protein